MDKLNEQLNKEKDNMEKIKLVVEDLENKV